MEIHETNQIGTSFEQEDEYQMEVGTQELANSMMKSVTEHVCKPPREPPTIYKVPERIRRVNKDGYEPKILSIGPYHQDKESLQGMEEHKWRYLYSILCRNPNHRLVDYLEAIKKLKDQAQSCYSDKVGHDGNKFVEMMVLDGCFIVELFLKNYEKRWVEDPVFTSIWMLPLIGYDMLLLENQIPFFVLKRIFDMVIDSPKTDSLVMLAHQFFLVCFPGFIPNNKKIRPDIDSVQHLLHLFHRYFIRTTTTQSNRCCNLSTVESIVNKCKDLLMPKRSKGSLPCSNKDQLPVSNNQTMTVIPCAAELHHAGIKFKKKEKWSSILDVEFSCGELKIPPLTVDDHTDGLFRNLVAFEQFYPKAKICFTTYVFFIDSLVNTSKDVALLHRNGIINNFLGSDEEVADLFNRLGNGIFDCPETYLSNVYKDVEKHCKTKWNMFRATLMQDYFTNPWAGLSSVAAAILLGVTITQTIFTIMPYYLQGPSS